MIEPLSHCGDVCSACTAATTTTTSASSGGIQWGTADPNDAPVDPTDGSTYIQYVGDYIHVHTWYYQPEISLWK